MWHVKPHCLEKNRRVNSWCRCST